MTKHDVGSPSGDHSITSSNEMVPFGIFCLGVAFAIVGLSLLYAGRVSLESFKGVVNGLALVGGPAAVWGVAKRARGNPVRGVILGMLIGFVVVLAGNWRGPRTASGCAGRTVAGSPVLVSFARPFSTPPAVVVSPVWNGSPTVVANFAETVQKLDGRGFTAVSGNYGPDSTFKFCWVAIEVR
jgi:hypothetical protein